MSFMKRFIGLLILILCVACVKVSHEYDGKYKGSDGAKVNPQEIHVILGVTGDGFINGSWRSTGEIEEAQFAGQIGLMEGNISLHVLSGKCKGDFKGIFKLKDHEFLGTLGDNPHCPESSYKFNVSKEAT
jgi:hypothetical protein